MNHELNVSRNLETPHFYNLESSTSQLQVDATHWQNASSSHFLTRPFYRLLSALNQIAERLFLDSVKVNIQPEQLIQTVVSGNAQQLKKLIATSQQSVSDLINSEHLIHLAIKNKQAHMIPMFVHAQADLNQLDSINWSPLQLAVNSGQRETVLYLLEQGARLHGSNYNQVLHLAVKHGFVNITLDLIQFNADLEVKDNQGKTPLHIAIQANQRHCAQLLIDHGANVNAQSSRGWTPLHHATALGRMGLLPLLLSAGAQVNQQNRTGQNACDLAILLDNLRLLGKLLKAGGVPSEYSLTDPNLTETQKQHAISLLLNSIANHQFNLSVDLSVQYPNLIHRNDFIHAIEIRRQHIIATLKEQFILTQQSLEAIFNSSPHSSLTLTSDLFPLIAQFGLDYDKADNLPNMLYPDQPTAQRVHLLRALFKQFSVSV